VDDTTDSFNTPIDHGVHRRLRGSRGVAFQDLTLQVNHHDILGLDFFVGDSRRTDRNGVTIASNADVPASTCRQSLLQ